MKKKTKKLVLAKETVRDLEDRLGREAMGGSAAPFHCSDTCGSCPYCLPDSNNDIC